MCDARTTLPRNYVKQTAPGSHNTCQLSRYPMQVSQLCALGNPYQLDQYPALRTFLQRNIRPWCVSRRGVSRPAGRTTTTLMSAAYDFSERCCAVRAPPSRDQRVNATLRRACGVLCATLVALRFAPALAQSDFVFSKQEPTAQHAVPGNGWRQSYCG